MVKTADKSKTPTTKARNYLQEVIMRLNEGQRLPALRQLSDSCKVSVPVISKVLEGFRNEGLVEFRPRSGVYRSVNHREREFVLPIMYFDHPEAMRPNNFINYLFGYLAGELANQNTIQKIWIMQNESEWSRVIKEIHERNAGFVMTYAMGMAHTEIVRQLETEGIHCLHVFPNLIQLPRPSIAIDDELLVRSQVDYLANKGHEKIAYLHPVCDERFHRGLMMRLNAFYRFAIEYKLKIEPDWVSYVGFDEEVIIQKTKDILSAKNRPTAIIIYDYHARAVYTALRELGMEIGKDIAVLGTDDMPWAEHMHPSLSSAKVSCVEVVNEIIAIFNRYIKANEFDKNQISLIETSLIARESS